MKTTLDSLLKSLKGGSKSGHWAHNSKPGRRGGSIPGGGFNKIGANSEMSKQEVSQLSRDKREQASSFQDYAKRDGFEIGEQKGDSFTIKDKIHDKSVEVYNDGERYWATFIPQKDSNAISSPGAKDRDQVIEWAINTMRQYRGRYDWEGNLVY